MPTDGSAPQSRLLFLLRRVEEREQEALRRGRDAVLERAWGMPSAHTFRIRPIRRLIKREMASGGNLD